MSHFMRDHILAILVKWKFGCFCAIQPTLRIQPDLIAMKNGTRQGIILTSLGLQRRWTGQPNHLGWTRWSIDKSILPSPSIRVCEIDSNLFLELFVVVIDIWVYDRSVANGLHYLQNGKVSIPENVRYQDAVLSTQRSSFSLSHRLYLSRVSLSTPQVSSRKTHRQVCRTLSKAL